MGVESTVVDLTTNPPTLLRPGGISAAQLREVLGDLQEDRAVTGNVEPGAKVRAPGMKYRHYAPKAPLVILKGSADKAEAYLAEQAKERRIAFLCYGAESRSDLPAGILVEAYGASEDAAELARGLFDALRRLDSEPLDVIYARIPENGDGLEQAVINRLEKAAGFQEITL